MLEQQYIEIFHLLFLRQLGERLNKDHYALKGGCNLRFYMKSIRYSEDIDFDVKLIAKETLRSNVRKILESPSFVMTLASKGLAVLEKSEPKQTETTQRWKLMLKTTEGQLPLHTKIEFSRRNLEDGRCFDAVDSEIVHGYGLYPIYSSHYDKNTAFEQKMRALISRTETQARDIFDLDLLLKAGAAAASLKKISKDALEKAQNNVLSMNYNDFTSQVLSYLLPEFRSHFPKEYWDGIVESIVDLLEKAK